MKMRDLFQDPSYNNSIWQTSGSKKKSKTNIKNERLCKKIYIILQKHIQTMAKIGKKHRDIHYYYHYMHPVI